MNSARGVPFLKLNKKKNYKNYLVDKPNYNNLI